MQNNNKMSEDCSFELDLDLILAIVQVLSIFVFTILACQALKRASTELDLYLVAILTLLSLSCALLLAHQIFRLVLSNQCKSEKGT